MPFIKLAGGRELLTAAGASGEAGAALLCTMLWACGTTALDSADFSLQPDSITKVPASSKPENEANRLF